MRRLAPSGDLRAGACMGVNMQYQDLQSLIDNSRECREYFTSLPLGLQLSLHRHDGLIHSDQDLHRYAELFSRLPPSRK